MNDAIVAGKKPHFVRFEKKGDAVLWCACGRSARQPFCDGSHKGTNFAPLRLTAHTDGEEALLCLCKKTKTPPYCDGSHNSLSAEYGVDAAEEHSIDWTKTELATRSDGRLGPALLDGGCFVLTPDRSVATQMDGWRLLPTINRSTGADKLSQWLLSSSAGAAAAIDFGAAEVILFVANGDPTIEISGARFKTAQYSAVAVRPGERFSIISGGDDAMLVATVCPPEPPTERRRPTEFHSEFPHRVIGLDTSARQSMGDRFFQVLTSASCGADQITQFIGMIPQSRSAPHHHLYEETLYVLSGEGFMWTQTRRAPVASGDVIYLPRKQLHSLECVSPEGMMLAGSFFPAGSPAINY